jgi:hypothetical protein
VKAHTSDFATGLDARREIGRTATAVDQSIQRAGRVPCPLRVNRCSRMRPGPRLVGRSVRGRVGATPGLSPSSPDCPDVPPLTRPGPSRRLTSWRDWGRPRKPFPGRFVDRCTPPAQTLERLWLSSNLEPVRQPRRCLASGFGKGCCHRQGDRGPSSVSVPVRRPLTGHLTGRVLRNSPVQGVGLGPLDGERPAGYSSIGTAHRDTVPREQPSRSAPRRAWTRTKPFRV